MKNNNHKKELPKSGGNGKSLKDAIIIDETEWKTYAEFENLLIDLIAISTCEKLIIKKKFTKIIEDRFFDIFILEKENNDQYKLYFEITACWNKQYINRLTFQMNN
jgi:hypothetical protein